jgi:hypothetical protein
MTTDENVKVRKIVYNKKGYQHGILLPPYAGDIDEAFNYYSGLWFGEHLDKDGNLYEYIDQKDAEYVDEFTFKESDHFYIGIPNTYAFEGITEDYAGYPGCELDEYGFEKMYNIEGKPIPYYDSEINN